MCPESAFKSANLDLVVAGIVTPTTDTGGQALKEVVEVMSVCRLNGLGRKPVSQLCLTTKGLPWIAPLRQ